MSLKEFVGAIIMEVDSREIEIVSISPKKNTGRKLVKTMNRSGRAAGFARGVSTIDLDVTAVIPKGAGEIDWAAIEGAKISLTPVTGGQRRSYIDCFTIEVGRKYETDNEARIDIKMAALDEVVE